MVSLTGTAPKIVRSPSFVYRAVDFGEKALCVLGTMMLLEVVRFILSGNAEPVTFASLETGNALVRASWYPFYLLVVIAILCRVKVFLQTIVRLLPIYLLLALTVASVFWSIAPDITLRRVIAVTMTVGFGIYMGLRGDWKETLGLIGIGCAIATVMNIVIAIGVPSIGVESDVHVGAWKGYTVEKNALGGDMARASLIFMALSHLDEKRRIIWLALLAFAVACVLGSTSTTALLAVMVPGVFYSLYLIGTRSVYLTFAAVYSGVVGAIAIVVALFVFPQEIADLFGKDLTLTGRTDIWAAAIRVIGERPMTGYGMGAFWVDPMGPAFNIIWVLEWLVPSAHNTWLETALSLGIPGVALLILITLIAIGRGVFLLVARGNPWPLSAVGQLVLFSFSESSILWFQNTFSCFMFIFFVTVAMIPAHDRLTGRRKAPLPGSLLSKNMFGLKA